VFRSWRELRPDHPQLLLERPDDLDPDVLRRRVELAEPLHLVSRALGCLGHTVGELADDDPILDLAAIEALELAAGRDCCGLAVG
jgi:hypothetical protein